jgi:hypothetical protein
VVGIPFLADYLSIQNLTTDVTVYFEEGDLFSQGPEATPVEPGAYISTRIRETQRITVFWSSPAPTVQGDIIALQFSDEFIPIQAGNITPNSTAANVNVLNAPVVNVNTLPALPAGGNAIGVVAVSALPAIPAGANAIGTVGVTALPAIPAGANAIGTVGVTALPAIPAGANAIGTVGVTALPALPAGANAIGSVGVTALPAIPAGANAIGTVGVTALPALPTGGNIIGLVVQVSGTSSTEITAAATTVVKASPGIVGTLINAGAAISGIVDVYDDPAAVGKKVWSGTLAAGAVLALNVPCGLGITIVTAAADTLLVSWN